MLTDALPLAVKLEVNVLWQSILEAGPSQKVDGMSYEVLQIREIYRAMLAGREPVSTKAGVAFF